MRQTLKLEREFYIPTGSTKVAAKDSDAVAYLYEDEKGNPCARGFGGKRAKPDFRFRFATLARREDHVSNYFIGQAKRKQAKVDERAKAKAGSHTLKVGSIVYTSWGYDQTNVDFYQVVEVVSGKTVRVRAIASRTEKDTGWASSDVCAAKDAFLDGALTTTHRVSLDNHLKIDGHYAWEDDGSSHHSSSYA